VNSKAHFNHVIFFLCSYHVSKQSGQAVPVKGKIELQFRPQRVAGWSMEIVTR